MTHWQVRLTPGFVKAARRLSPENQQRIARYLAEIAPLSDPRVRGRGLSGELAGYWRYHLGDLRIICEILDTELVILALTVVRRSQAYR